MRLDPNNPEDRAFLEKHRDRKTGKTLLQLALESSKETHSRVNEKLDKNSKPARVMPARIEQNQIIEIELPYPPSVNHLYTQAKNSGKRVLTKAGRAYKNQARQMISLTKPFIFTGEVILTITIFRPRKAGDTSNRVKIAEDCLKGYYLTDDEQVAELHVYRKFDKENPRILVKIQQAPI